MRRRMLHSISTPFAASITLSRFGKKMPTIPQLKTCCCCFTTETGTKIIGWLETIFSIIAMILTIYALSLHNEAKKDNEDTADTAVVAVSLVLFCFNAILGIFLLVGVDKQKMSYVRLWVVLSIVILVIKLATILIRMILAITVADGNRGASVGGEVISLILSFIIASYFILVVYSYYREKKAGSPENL